MTEIGQGYIPREVECLDVAKLQSVKRRLGLISTRVSALAPNSIWQGGSARFVLNVTRLIACLISHKERNVAEFFGPTGSLVNYSPFRIYKSMVGLAVGRVLVVGSVDELSAGVTRAKLAEGTAFRRKLARESSAMVVPFHELLRSSRTGPDPASNFISRQARYSVPDID